MTQKQREGGRPEKTGGKIKPLRLILTQKPAFIPSFPAGELCQLHSRRLKAGPHRLHAALTEHHHHQQQLYHTEEDGSRVGKCQHYHGTACSGHRNASGKSPLVSAPCCTCRAVTPVPAYTTTVSPHVHRCRLTEAGEFDEKHTARLYKGSVSIHLLCVCALRQQKLASLLPAVQRPPARPSPSQCRRRVDDVLAAPPMKQGFKVPPLTEATDRHSLYARTVGTRTRHHRLRAEAGQWQVNSQGIRDEEEGVVADAVRLSSAARRFHWN